ncbi:MAG: VRR-NUC domain-containing protein [Methylibium sp.]|nr:VRR-NUC domain-containing protein [Methylibium sp.]
MRGRRGRRSTSRSRRTNVDGRLLRVEVKGPTGRLRPKQVVFLERIRVAGGVAFMARDCRDVLCELK